MRIGVTVMIVVLMMASVVFIPMTIVTLHERSQSGPWYLGCSDGEREYLMQVESRPRVDGGVVFIGSDVFVVPEPGMTCRMVRVSEVDVDKLKE